jgi:sulfatase maturation enzyme AslB (radical SAM superfamily)
MHKLLSLITLLFSFTANTDIYFCTQIFGGLKKIFGFQLQRLNESTLYGLSIQEKAL